MGTTLRRTKIGIVAATGATVLAGLTIAATANGPAAGNGWHADAVLRDAAGDRVGTVSFDGGTNATTVKVTTRRITTGLDVYHGLHIHANDAAQPCDPAGGFTNVGGHWNPTAAVHGSHAGDLPTLLVQLDGTGRARSVTGRFEPQAIDGRAVILHAGPDNFANIPAARYSTGSPPVAGADDTTKLTGDAGGRIACGIIAVD